MFLHWWVGYQVLCQMLVVPLILGFFHHFENGILNLLLSLNIRHVFSLYLDSLSGVRYTYIFSYRWWFTLSLVHMIWSNALEEQVCNLHHISLNVFLVDSSLLIICSYRLWDISYCFYLVIAIWSNMFSHSDDELLFTCLNCVLIWKKKQSRTPLILYNHSEIPSWDACDMR